jgi:hypothetical protein
LAAVGISLSGFSQSTYGYIHGLSLKKALDNFTRFCTHARKENPDIRLCAYWHKYRFNENEQSQAKDYFEQLQVTFIPYPAYPGDVELFIEAISNGDKYKILNEDMHLSWIKEKCRMFASELHYICPQYKYIVVASDGRLLQCCALSGSGNKYVIGHVFDTDFNDLERIKSNSDICAQCIKFGIAQYYHANNVE